MRTGVTIKRTNKNNGNPISEKGKRNDINVRK
jgi:hypothetical protein